MKHALIATTLVILTGCTSVASTQGYRPANYAGSPWMISGEMNQASNEITITINGTPVATGKLSLWTGDGDVVGSYEGKAVMVSCITKYGTRCTVFIENERAASLTFQ